MTGFSIAPIAWQPTEIQASLLPLNNTHREATSFLTEEDWRAMIEIAFHAACIQPDGVLLITFDQDADYDGVNFQWFRA